MPNTTVQLTEKGFFFKCKLTLIMQMVTKNEANPVVDGFAESLIFTTKHEGLKEYIIFQLRVLRALRDLLKFGHDGDFLRGRQLLGFLKYRDIPPSPVAVTASV